MKKMTKGAIVTGLGVALLLGGGGTLAVWNQDATAHPGTIAAGDLDLKAAPGQWTSTLSGPIEDITAYRIIPGETLTYTQVLDVTLKGDEIEAVLTTDGTRAADGFVPSEVAISQPVLSTGERVLTAADHGQPVTATTTFEFKESATESQDAAYDFGAVRYVLTQQNPDATAGA